MKPEQSAFHWYASCRSYFRVPEALRRGVSRQLLAHYRKVHDLPPELGEDLDRRAAPFAIVRWVAWVATRAEQRARHAAAVKHYASTGRWPRPSERGGSRRAKRRAA